MSIAKETKIPQKNRKPKSGRRKHTLERLRIRANAKEIQILETITLLGIRVTEWFDVAPEEMHEDFARRFRKRIGELID